MVAFGSGIGVMDFRPLPNRNLHVCVRMRICGCSGIFDSIFFHSSFTVYIFSGYFHRYGMDSSFIMPIYL